MIPNIQQRRRPGPIRYLLLAVIAVALTWATKNIFPESEREVGEILGPVRIQIPGQDASKDAIARAGTPYRVVVTPLGTAVHCYIFMVSPNADVQALFPTSQIAVANPIEKMTLLPSEEGAFLAEAPRGTHLLVTVSAVTPLADVGDVFSEKARAELANKPPEEQMTLIRERAKDVLSSEAFLTVQISTLQIAP